MALEFIWNSFIMIWSLIRKGGSSDGNGCWSLTFYIETNSDHKNKLLWNSFIMIWSLIRKMALVARSLTSYVVV